MATEATSAPDQESVDFGRSAPKQKAHLPLQEMRLSDHRERSRRSRKWSAAWPQFLLLSTSAPFLIIEIVLARSRTSIVDQA
jgi:hypothetical protein